MLRMYFIIIKIGIPCIRKVKNKTFCRALRYNVDNILLKFQGLLKTFLYIDSVKTLLCINN